MEGKQTALFDERFLESFTGTGIVSEPKIAIIELIANSWDAGASKVEIKWPNESDNSFFIRDNGHGMSESEFDKRFRKLAYNRQRDQGIYAEIPRENSFISKRLAFGKNGKGRFAGFCFGPSFFVKTWKKNNEVTVKVFKGNEGEIFFQKIDSKEGVTGHGTMVYADNAKIPIISANLIKREIGMRFLTHPNFEVAIDGEKITFLDIPEKNIKEFILTVEGFGEVKLIAIDTLSTDKTTHQHGIAWHVNGRLVGECSWKGTGMDHLIDGRRIEAKRFIFIVLADILNSEKNIHPDWSGFKSNSDEFQSVNEVVLNKVKDFVLDISKEKRKETFYDIKSQNNQTLKRIGLIGQTKWNSFITQVQEECPSINETELAKLGTILANLEESQSQFSLIHALYELDPNQLDNLNEILEEWNVDLAKIVLDELQFRLKLLEQLKIKVLSKNTDEVQELQPLFKKGLWIFGPEYETIEYTSNQGMTSVIQNLYGGIEKGSRKRPDFAILSDSTVGLYSYPKYDDEGGEIGVDRLTIVELKKPGVPLSSEQKSQAWGYVKELTKKGYVTPENKITCFVLGSEIDPLEAQETHQGGTKIIPLLYDTVVKRANSRLLNLYDKVKNSPFLENVRLEEELNGQMNLLEN
ncbi:MAG: ATP-binding protein [Algoriphagus sp.]|nr:ATP-binding protein [Algoriphagus sp.]